MSTRVPVMSLVGYEVRAIVLNGGVYEITMVREGHHDQKIVVPVDKLFDAKGKMLDGYNVPTRDRRGPAFPRLTP